MYRIVTHYYTDTILKSDKVYLVTMVKSYSVCNFTFGFEGPVVISCILSTLYELKLLRRRRYASTR